MSRGTWPFVLWTCLILLAVLPWTSYQNHTHWDRVAWIPFVSPPLKLRDILVNVALYGPWGFFAARLMRRSWTVVLLAAVLSFATEASQLYSHGRFPSATDFVCNVLGAYAGATYARRGNRRSQ